MPVPSAHGGPLYDVTAQSPTDVAAMAANKVLAVGYTAQLIDGNLGPSGTFVIGTGSG